MGGGRGGTVFPSYIVVIPQKNDWANVSEICECEVEDQYGYFTDISFTGASGTLANCNMIIDHLAHRTNISLK